jgi:tight adherence protein C
MLLMILTFAGTFGLICSAGLLVFYRDAVWERLSVVVDQRLGPAARLSQFVDRKRSAVEQIVLPFQNVLPRNPKDVSVLQKRLIRAGYRQESAVNMFYGAKALLPLVVMGLLFVTGVYNLSPILALLGGAALGFVLPDLWLGNRVTNRKLLIGLGLPEALDLMVICTEAGLSMDQTLLRVSRELRVGQPEVADELGLAVLEQKAGKPRADTLKDLGERTNVPSVRAFVNTLVQSDVFGTSVAKTLRIYSDTLRTQRRQKAEEDAAKTTVKLVLPLVVFIFPSIFIVVLGPALISMNEAFTKYLSNFAK